MQTSWIEEMGRMGYSTAADMAVLDKMRGQLLMARMELAKLLGQTAA